MEGYPSVKEAVVVPVTDESGDKQLCAYFVFNASPGNGEAVEMEEALTAYLRESLPDYMIPGYFMRLSEIPLTANGKVNRRALPKPEGRFAEYTAPRNDTERALVLLWSEVLGTDAESIGIDANFFQVGGHSLKATLMVSRLHQKLGVKVGLGEVFKSPTIRGLARFIDGGEGNGFADAAVGLQPVEKQEYYPLSAAQSRLYLLEQMEDIGTAYNMPLVVLLKGELDLQRLENSFRRLIRRHESFRTSFRTVDGHPVQVIDETVPFALPIYPDRGDELKERFFRVQGRLFQKKPLAAGGIADFVTPFNLSRAPLIRAALFPLEAEEHLLLFDMHHIVSDGFSTGILAREFMALYGGEELPPLRIQYKDYAIWFNGEKESVKKQEAFWLEQFEGDIPVLELPTDFARPVVQQFDGRAIPFDITAREAGALREIAGEAGATLYMVLAAIYAIFLSRLSNQEEIVMGTPVAGRNHAGLDQVIGMFVNTLGLRFRPCGDKPFSVFLEEVKTTTLSAFANQDYPLESLVNRVAVARDASRNPLFDCVFSLDTFDIPTVEKGGLALETCGFESGIAKFDLTLFAVDTADAGGGVGTGNLRFRLQYAVSLFTEETVRQFSCYFKRLLSAVAENPGCLPGKIEILSPEEKQQLLVGFNRIEADFDKNRTIHGLFQRQVERTPHQIALVGTQCDNVEASAVSFQPGRVPAETESLSYRALNQYADSLARHLRLRGAGPGSVVGLLVERSIHMIIGTIAILKTGAAYLPINPKNPPARTEYMLQDSEACLLVTHRDLDHFFEAPCPVVRLEKGDIYDTYAAADEDSPDDASALAYIIYTSGSTGNPKGVPITHSNFSPLVHWGYQHLGLAPGDRALQNLSNYFDWSVWEIFIVLTSGARLYMMEESLVLNPRAMVERIRRQEISVLHITPTQYSYLVNVGHEMKSLKHLCIGAEKLTLDLVERTLPYISQECRIYNMYGPTEATIISAVLEVEQDRFMPPAALRGRLRGGRQGEALYPPAWRAPGPPVARHLVSCDASGIHSSFEDTDFAEGGGGCPDSFVYYRQLPSMPIGHKAGNTDLLVLDRHMNPCPVGVEGELFVAGDGLSAGYLKDPEKTAAVFIPNPFEEVRGHRLYKTGDRAKRLADGTVLFMGRVDFQVKIRGYRIELGEIENTLLADSVVKEALVTAKEEPLKEDEKYLCAYIVPAGGIEGFSIQEVRARLISQLPDYMVPARFVVMERFPLNPNGKVDLKSLPTPEIYNNDTQYVPPANDSQRRLVEIWRQVLQVPEVGMNQDFFGLGGHSMNALELVNAIERSYGVKLGFQDVYRNPTAADLHSLILQRGGDGYESIPRQPVQPHYELSYNQKRLWLLNKFAPESAAFNLPVRVTLNETVDEAVVRQVLEILVQRHDSFRTYIGLESGEPMQVVLPEVEIPIETIDISNLPSQQLAEQRETLYKEESRALFQLDRPPLFRSKIIKCGADEFDLILTMHHIITDGWSLQVLAREFSNLFEKLKKGEIQHLEPLPIQYKDYVAWHNNLLADPTKMESAKTFWESQLTGSGTLLALPYDFVARESDTPKSAGYRCVIPGSTLEGLHRIAREGNASLFMVLLAGFKVMLWRITGTREILLGFPGAARQHDDLKDMVGLFVNTLVLRNVIDPDVTFTSFLETLQENTFQVLEHQSFPLELICKEFKLKYPELSVFFNMLTFGNTQKEDLDNMEPYHIEEVQDAKFDIVCYLSEHRNGVSIDTHYRKTRFRPETIEKILKSYSVILSAIAADPAQALRQYNISTKKRKLSRKKKR